MQPCCKDMVLRWWRKIYDYMLRRVTARLLTEMRIYEKGADNGSRIDRECYRSLSRVYHDIRRELKE